jgi:hypothetical protein
MGQYNIHFHNSVGLAQDELARAIKQAKTQEERIIFLFELNGVSMTPAEMHKAYIKYYPLCPITSIRRAMTNLTNAGRLLKTKEQVKGDYNFVNYRWKLIR